MSSMSVSLLTQPRSKSKKARTRSKGRRTKPVEKKIEGRDEELPWPSPNDAAHAIYNDLFNSHVKFNPMNHVNLLSLNQSVLDKGGRMDKQINTMQKNSDKYLLGGTSNAYTLNKCGPLPLQATGSSMLFNPAVMMPMPMSVGNANLVAPASSDDVCTLFQNSCRISSSQAKQLTPIGVFWDIENCSVPKGKSALATVQRIRDRFFPGHYESEFVCVCDIRKEHPAVIQELNDAQVTVIHVAGNSKNAADDKLRQSMRRFADIYSSGASNQHPATVVLISGDINFSSDLSDLRHRKRLYVVLLHNKHAPDALLLCAHEQYNFHSLLGDLPNRPSYKEPNPPDNNGSNDIPLKGGLNAMDLLVCDLPQSNSTNIGFIKSRLKKLSENCGGKIVSVDGKVAIIRFPNKEAALRASKRMNGEDVLGSKIRVIYNSQMEFRGQSQMRREEPILYSPSPAQQMEFRPQNRKEEVSAVDQETLKKEVAALLQDVPDANLPLFKFREMFEKRYHRSISTSDLYRLRGVVTISETGPLQGGFGVGRTVSLSSDCKVNDPGYLSLYCSTHPPTRTVSKPRMGWAEKEAEILLPNVQIELKTLQARVQTLLNSHNGSLPLISFLDCYEAEFERMETAEDGLGVSLEHLLTCVKDSEITFGANRMKKLQFVDKSQIETAPPAVPLPPSAIQLAQFSREMIDLLKTFPRCTLAFSKLIPAYHHHFGRQCRVADYGYLNLQALLQAVPHAIQIMGASHNRILTLSHKAQMKRFATDLLRVLKGSGGVKKQIKVSDFPQAFSQVFPTRQFAPEDYGLCYLSDLITELVENSTLVALMKDEDGNQILAVPKREQTLLEMQRTKTFAKEVVDLLRHSIRFEMPFSKFIPSYHHHFGKQCRVSNYGFTKLAELLEAVSDTVVVVPSSGRTSECGTDDKLLRLVPQEQIKAVGEQLNKLVRMEKEKGKGVRVSDIEELFVIRNGFQLSPETCEAVDVEDLITGKLSAYLKTDENGLVTATEPPTPNENDKSSPEEPRTKSRNGRYSTFFGRMNARCQSTEQYRPYNNLFKNENGRWSDPPKRQRMPPPPPLFIPPLASPGFTPRVQNDPGIFTFDRPSLGHMNSPVSAYDMWMQKPMSPISPPVSPPIVWTYHPIVYPPNTPPAQTANIVLPSFSFGSPWSPATLAPCYDARMAMAPNSGMGNGPEFIFPDPQTSRLIHGMERIGLEPRNEG